MLADARERGLVKGEFGERAVAVDFHPVLDLLPDDVVGERPAFPIGHDSRAVVVDELVEFIARQSFEPHHRSAKELIALPVVDDATVVAVVHRGGDVDDRSSVAIGDRLEIGAFGRPDQSLLVLLSGIERGLDDDQSIARFRDEFRLAVVIGNQQVTTGDDPVDSVMHVAIDGVRSAVSGERISAIRHVFDGRHDHGFVERDIGLIHNPPNSFSTILRR